MLEVIDRGEFLEFVYAGAYDVGALVELARVVNDRCTAQHRWGALVDVATINEVLPRLALWEQAKAMASFWNRRIRLAVIGNPEQASADLIDSPNLRQDFWQLTLQNQGIRARVFTDRAEATSWLVAALRDAIK